MVRMYKCYVNKIDLFWLTQVNMPFAVSFLRSFIALLLKWSHFIRLILSKTLAYIGSFFTSFSSELIFAVFNPMSINNETVTFPKLFYGIFSDYPSIKMMINRQIQRFKSCMICNIKRFSFHKVKK